MPLHLLPNLLSEEQDPFLFLPLQVKKVVENLEALVCESEKGGRSFLFLFLSREKVQQIPLYLLNEHTEKKEIETLAKTIFQDKKNWGAVSDAGLCCLSDPMHKLVFLLQKKKYPVIAYAGPSAPIYALMLSGFSGEKFSYHGYLPREEPFLRKQILKLERESQQEKRAQIWIEAPYRTQKMALFCIQTLSPKTWFGVFQNLESSSQRIDLETIQVWRQKKVHWSKAPAVFLLQA